MRFRIRPVETSFYEMFTSLAQQLVVGAQITAEMLDPGADRAEVGERMHNAERAADDMTHGIVRQVNSTFVTPFDRDDIYTLASRLDDVMDLMDEAVDRILLYEIEKLPSDFADLVDTLRRAADITAEAMPRLRTLKDLEEYWIEINRLENEGDRTHRRIVAKLFSGKYKALEVLKLKDVVDSLEGALDALESVANTVEQIAVKES